jgi:two-component system chemotaxis response regulator CheB
MANRDLVVVGASAGGVEALRELVHDLPVDFPAAVLIVLHLPSSAFSALPSILKRAGELPVFTAQTGMPRAAVRAVPNATLTHIDELAKVLTELCREDVGDPKRPAWHDLDTEVGVAEFDEAAMGGPHRPGRPAAMTCPDCNGAMFEFDEGDLVRYRCRVGHAWSSESLLMQQVETAETALWAAIRALEEKASLHRRIIKDISRPSALTEAYHAERATEAERSAAALRDLLRRPLTDDAVGSMGLQPDLT